MYSTKSNIGSLFDRIANSYDRFNHLLSLNIDRRWRRQAVSAIQVETAASEQADTSNHIRCLDVAVGTADLAIEVLKRGKADEVVGIDLSNQMMKVGQKKAEQQNLSQRLTFTNASALDMPFQDNEFDVVTCGYGVRNFSDLKKGLEEMFRVLKPNGQLVILEFSYPNNKLFAALYDFYFKNIMPLVGKILSKDKAPFLYFYQSVRNFIWGERMKEQLQDIGFADVTYTMQTFGISTLYVARKYVSSE